MTSTLRQKLEEATKSHSRCCKLAEVLDSLDAETREYIVKILDVPPATPKRISDAVLSQVFRSEGLVVGRSTINEHRRHLCSCYSEES